MSRSLRNLLPPFLAVVIPLAFVAPSACKKDDAEADKSDKTEEKDEKDKDKKKKKDDDDSDDDDKPKKKKSGSDDKDDDKGDDDKPKKKADGDDDNSGPDPINGEKPGTAPTGTAPVAVKTDAGVKADAGKADAATTASASVSAKPDAGVPLFADGGKLPLPKKTFGGK
jgi:hypothetical protein